MFTWDGQEDIQKQVINQLLGHIDIFPTLLELTGSSHAKARIWDLMEKVLLIALWKRYAWIDNRIFVVDDQRRLYPKEWNGAAVLMKKWRLTQQNKLFDISTDPNQKVNIAKNNKNILSLLGNYYHNWYQSVTAKVKIRRFIVETKNSSC